MRLSITRKGTQYVLKTCAGCGDEWYAKRKQNRCTLCSSGLVIRTRQNIHLNWDELNPAATRRAEAPVRAALRGFSCTPFGRSSS